jgi:hypothetical protein
MHCPLPLRCSWRSARSTSYCSRCISRNPTRPVLCARMIVPPVSQPRCQPGPAGAGVPRASSTHRQLSQRAQNRIWPPVGLLAASRDQISMCFTVEIGHRPSCPLIAMRSPCFIVEEELIDRAGLPVSQDDCPADQLLFGSMQFAEDVHGSLVAGARSTHVWEL